MARKIKTYSGWITDLKQDECFVFGSNLDGFHGAGSAGFASFNEPGNQWRNFEYGDWKDGERGEWNVKGKGEGYQEGRIGRSYALPTVDRIGAPKRDLEEIKNSIKTFYDFATSNPKMKFYVAQENKQGLCGHTPEELGKLFAAFSVPANVYFNESFEPLIRK